MFAARQPYSKKRVTESVRVIDKDIPRTDRELEMFRFVENQLLPSQNTIAQHIILTII